MAKGSILDACSGNCRKVKFSSQQEATGQVPADQKNLKNTSCGKCGIIREKAFWWNLFLLRGWSHGK